MKPYLKPHHAGHPSSPYIHFTEQEWAAYRSNTKLTLTESELAQLRGFNESISLEQAQNIYLPLCRLLNLHVAAAQNLHNVAGQFLDNGASIAKVPYIIGISGSVAVGKSTTSRILQTLLSRWPNHTKVDLITTDGFLYSNDELRARQLLDKKGFPQSFDLKTMVDTLLAVKSGTNRLQVPLYSHEQYDIVPNGYQLISNPDILIVEGLNLLNTQAGNCEERPTMFVSDFLDFTIYVDASTHIIEQWFLDRFMAFRRQAENHPQRFFHRFTQMTDIEAYRYALNVWRTVNEANLKENILPYKYRADLILTKSDDHTIDAVSLRRL